MLKQLSFSCDTPERFSIDQLMEEKQRKKAIEKDLCSKRQISLRFQGQLRMLGARVGLSFTTWAETRNWNIRKYF